MALRLCLALGCPSVDLLWELLTWTEWREWREFYELEPWGDLRADLRQVALAVTVLGAVSGGAALPEPTYPYFAPDVLDTDETSAALDDHLAAVRLAARRRRSLAGEWRWELAPLPAAGLEPS